MECNWSGEEEERRILGLLEKPQSFCPASEVLVCIVKQRGQIWDYSMAMVSLSALTGGSHGLESGTEALKEHVGVQGALGPVR